VTKILVAVNDYCPTNKKSHVDQVDKIICKR